jgi:hypothetical protein
MLGGGAAAVFAQGGEDCQNATVVVTLPLQTTFDNQPASADGPAGSCNSSQQGEMQNDLWWMIPPVEEPCLMNVQVSVDGWDAVVVAYMGSHCGDEQELRCASGQGLLEFRFLVPTGQVVWVQIGQDGSTPRGGPGGLVISCDPIAVEVDQFPVTVCQMLVQRKWEQVRREQATYPPVAAALQTAPNVQFFNNGLAGAIALSQLKAVVVGNPQVTQVGKDEQADFDVVMEGFAHVFDPRVGQQVKTSIELTGVARTVLRGRNGEETGTWDTEMVSMSLSGTTPGGLDVVIRESPTEESGGGTTITELPDEAFNVDSFFDIWTEVSIDGGNSWQPAPEPGRLNMCQPGVVTTSESGNVFPPDGAWINPEDYAVLFTGEFFQVRFDNLQLLPKKYPPASRTVVGDDEIVQFAVTLYAQSFDLFLTNTNPVPVVLEGQAEMLIKGGAVKDTGTFETEILSMDLRGTIPGFPGEVVFTEQAGEESVGELTSFSFGIGRGGFQTSGFVEIYGGLQVGGDIQFFSTEFVRVDLGPAPKLVSAVGPTTVEVYFEGPAEGDARDDDQNGLDEVETEIVAMNLRGSSPLGPIVVEVQGGEASRGQIEEQKNENNGTLDVAPFDPGGVADSFFDVWPEISFAGMPFETRSPVRVRSAISHKPPVDGECFVSPFYAELPLIDVTTGTEVPYCLVRKSHIVSPTVEIDIFEDSIFALCLGRSGSLTNQPEWISLRGSTEIHVYFEGASEGDAKDDSLNGLDEVATQLVALNMSDFSGNTLRVRSIAASPFTPSLGGMEEQENPTPGTLDIAPFASRGMVDSFFDVFVELELPTGEILHNESPLRIGAVLSHKPDGAPHFLIVSTIPVPLFDESNVRTDRVIKRGVHHTGVIEYDFFPKTTALLELTGEALGGSPVLLALSGPARHHVYFEGAEGDGDDDDGDGRDEVIAELAELNLSQGARRLRLWPGQNSVGEMEEQVNNTPGLVDLDPFAPGNADSFFDVFLEIELEGGRVLHTGTAVHMEAVLNHKPDIVRYHFRIPPGGLELLDEAHNPSGIFLTDGEHYTGCIEVDVLNNSRVQFDLIHPDESSEAVQLTGSSRIHVYFEADEGRARDDDGDGLDEVETEIVSLSLRGDSSLGPVVLQLTPGAVGAGEIEELVNMVPGALDLPPFTSAGTAQHSVSLPLRLHVGGNSFSFGATPYPSGVVSWKPATAGDLLIDPGFIPLLDAVGPSGFSVNGFVYEPDQRPIIVRIVRNPDGSLTVCWPLQASGFQLQGTLAYRPGTWVTIPGTGFTVGNLNYYTFFPFGYFEAYRLFR